jgi:hypothetical protein
MAKENKYEPLTDSQKKDNEALYFSKKSVLSRAKRDAQFPWNAITVAKKLQKEADL